MSYRDQIIERIKDAVNNHIEKLKSEKPELRLTKQWQVIFEDGFTPGHVTLPVVTNSKKGKHLVADVEFIVPDNLEIDLDEIELSLRDEPFKQKKVVVTPALDQPLGVLNDIIVGVNNFLSELTFSVKPMQSFGPVTHMNPQQSSSPQMPSSLKVNAGNYNLQDINEVRDQIRASNMLPEWLRSISNRDVYNTLIDKIAEGYVQYVKTKFVSLQEFFKLYEDYLKREGKLYDYCKYKAQVVTLDDNGYCTEGYCSKRNYNKTCEHSILQFGKK
jgi:hypothetical protein